MRIHLFEAIRVIPMGGNQAKVMKYPATVDLDAVVAFWPHPVPSDMSGPNGDPVMKIGTNMVIGGSEITVVLPPGDVMDLKTGDIECNNGTWENTSVGDEENGDSTTNEPKIIGGSDE